MEQPQDALGPNKRQKTREESCNMLNCNMLNCTICKSKIDHVEHMPVIMCKHIICLNCIQKPAPLAQSQIFCHLCNQVVKFDPKNIMVNEQLLGVIETVKPQEHRLFCSIHPEKDIDFQC